MNGSILIVDDESNIRETLKLFLKDEGFSADEASDGNEALEMINKKDYDIIITDLNMPKMDGIELIKKASQISPDSFFMIMTAYASVKTAIEALRLGAYDYLLKPIEFEDLLMRIKRLLKYKSIAAEQKYIRRHLQETYSLHNIVGKSEAMRKVFEIIERVSQTNSNVLIIGKSGTGKELVAKAIHYNGPRRDKIFLPVNCGAISETLIESELFGHKKGAFTGATEDKLGLFKVADGGTIFLDEIGDLPLNMQVKLLRVLEDKQFLPVGGTKPITTDARIIAATNQNLYEKVKEKTFREDLYYRLSVVEIKLPSLDERREDIPLLVEHFIQKYNAEIGRKVLGIENDALRALMNYDYRGGVRELENIIERAIIFCKGEKITVDDLGERVISSQSFQEYPESLKEATRIFEREHILKIFKKYNYDKEEAAKALNIGLSSLYRKMEELNIPTKISREIA